jgi:hypothetical protein
VAGACDKDLLSSIYGKHMSPNVSGLNSFHMVAVCFASTICFPIT